jgi:MFS family permease
MPTRRPDEISNASAHQQSLSSPLSWISISAWFMCSLFYMYQYAVRSAPEVMQTNMASTWGVDAVGRMISLYYVVYSFVALAAGTLLDRLGARKTIPFATLVVAGGTLLLATGSEPLGVFGFVSQGAGAVFAFIGSVYVAAKYLPQHLSLFVGASQMLGMAGAAFGTKPVQAAIDPNSGHAWSWQHVWLFFAVIGVLLAVGLWIALPRDQQTTSKSQPRLSLKSLIKPYGIVFANPQTYLCGLIGGLLFAPTTIGVMVWATKFLHQGKNLSLSEAATDASLVPIGWIIGCPLLGYISDRIGRRKPVLLIGASFLLLALVAALYVPAGFALRYVIALAIGVASGAAMIPFTVVKEVNPDEVKGSAAGTMNFLCFMVTGLLAPVFQRFLQPAEGHAETLSGFQHGLSPLIYGVGIAIILAFFLRETGVEARLQHPAGSPGATALEQKPSDPIPSNAS